MTPRCCGPRPTRSTPPASTASWCPAWPTTRWSSATAATSCRSPASSSSPKRPGGWLDPGPYGCLGAGLGSAIAARIARPSAQVVLLLGDGAAGMSLMDVDTLVRHDLPVVMVCGNNSAWGLEKGPMQMLYGYDVAADLAPQTRYDQVVTALGRRRRDGHRPGPDRPGAGPCVRVREALPRQRHHRRGRGLPARHLRGVRTRDGHRAPRARRRAPRGRRADRRGVRRRRAAGRGRPLRRPPAGRRSPAPARPSCTSPRSAASWPGP